MSTGVEGKNGKDRLKVIEFIKAVKYSDDSPCVDGIIVGTELVRTIQQGQGDPSILKRKVM